MVLSTQPYIFDMWRTVAHSYGYEEYAQSSQDVTTPLRQFSASESVLWMERFGETGLAAEHEMIQVAHDILERAAAQPTSYTIRLSSQRSGDDLKILLGLAHDSGINSATIDDTLSADPRYQAIYFAVTADDTNQVVLHGGRRVDGVELVSSYPLLSTFLHAHQLLPEPRSHTDMTIIPLGNVYSSASQLAAKFRKLGVNVNLDASDRELPAKLASLTTQQTRYVLFVGEDELKDERYPLKDLVTGKEEKHSLERTVALVKDYRKHS